MNLWKKSRKYKEVLTRFRYEGLEILILDVHMNETYLNPIFCIINVSSVPIFL